MALTSLMEQLEKEIADTIGADPDLAAVTIVQDAQKNVIAEVTRQIGMLRFCIVPLVATAGVKNPDEPGPHLELIQPMVTVLENPTAKLPSGVSLTARKICERVHGILHLFKPLSVSTPLFSMTNAIDVVPDGSLNVYQNNFGCEGALTYQMPQAATPAAVNNAGTLTLSCTTAGAAMFYLTDGTRPTPRGGTLYTAPFAPGAGRTIKVRAFLAGYLSSEVLSVQT